MGAAGLANAIWLAATRADNVGLAEPWLAMLGKVMDGVNADTAGGIMKGGMIKGTDGVGVLAGLGAGTAGCFESSDEAIVLVVVAGDVLALKSPIAA